MFLIGILASTYSKTWRVLLILLLIGWVSAHIETPFLIDKNLSHFGDDAVLVTGGITLSGYKNRGRDKSNNTERNDRQMHAFAGLRQIDAMSEPIDMWGASFRRMVIKANPGVEVIIHNWNPHLASSLRNAYSPVKSQFEANEAYEKQFSEVMQRNNQSAYGQISRAYSFMQAGLLMVEREKERGKKFRRVVFVRSDVLYFTPLRIRDMIAPTVVYTGPPGCGLNSDDYFAMTRNAAVQFSKMYNFIGKELPAMVAVPGHLQCGSDNRHWMRLFIEDHMNMTLKNHKELEVEIYRRISYEHLVKHADYLKSLGYTFGHALMVASRCSHHLSRERTKEEADAYEVVGAFKKSPKAISDDPRRRNALIRMKVFWGEEVEREVVKGVWFCKKHGIKCKVVDKSICLKALLCTDRNVGAQL